MATTAAPIEQPARCGRIGCRERGARSLAGFCNTDVPSFLISGQRLAGPACRKLPGCIALPVVALTADLGDLDAAVTLGGRAKSGTRLDRLKLLRGVAMGNFIRYAEPDNH